MKQKKKLMKYQKLNFNSINLLILFLLLLVPIKICAMPKATDEFYVNDFANVLTDETKKYIIEQGNKMYNSYGAQIVVATVNNLEGKDINTYSLEMAREYKIGSSKKNSGLLILLAVSERDIRVEVGTGLEGILPDGKTGRLIDEYIIPYFKENKFDEGILSGYKSFYSIIEANKDEIGVPVKKVEEKEPYYKIYLGFEILIIIHYLIFKGKYEGKKYKLLIGYEIATFLIVLMVYFSKENYGNNVISDFLTLSFVNLTIIYLGKYILWLIIESTFGGGGSSFGGGSSGGSFYSKGSSSSSHSSGGGGSFSGGGASRHF